MCVQDIDQRQIHLPLFPHVLASTHVMWAAPRRHRRRYLVNCCNCGLQSIFFRKDFRSCDYCPHRICQYCVVLIGTWQIAVKISHSNHISFEHACVGFWKGHWHTRVVGYVKPNLNIGHWGRMIFVAGVVWNKWYSWTCSTIMSNICVPRIRRCDSHKCCIRLCCRVKSRVFCTASMDFNELQMHCRSSDNASRLPWPFLKH